MENFENDSFIFIGAENGIDPGSFGSPDPGAFDGLDIPGADLFDGFGGGGGGAFPGQDAAVGDVGFFNPMQMPRTADGAGGKDGEMPDLSGVDGSMAGATADENLDSRFGKGNWTRDSDGNVVVKENGTTYTFGSGIVEDIEDGEQPEDGLWVKTGPDSYVLFSPSDVGRDAGKALGLMENPYDDDGYGEITLEGAKEIAAKFLAESDPLIRTTEGDDFGGEMSEEEMLDFIFTMNDPITRHDPDAVEQAPITAEDVILDSDPLINPGNPVDDMFV